MKQSLVHIVHSLAAVVLSSAASVVHAEVAGDVTIVPSQLGLSGDFTLSTESLLMVSVVLVALVMIPRKRKTQ